MVNELLKINDIIENTATLNKHRIIFVKIKVSLIRIVSKFGTYFVSFTNHSNADES